MVTMLIRCTVADYDFWRPRYDTAVARDSGLGLRSSRVWRSQDDPNLVVIMETFDSREAVEALLSNPAVQAEMVADGVDASSAQIDFLDET
jgi:Antibiotic biosynthesis monooxygenase